MLDIGLVKTQNPSSNITFGSIITYTIAIQNKGDVLINNATFLDTIPLCTSFIANSLTVNGNVIPGKIPNAPGVFIGTIPVAATTTISFRVMLNTVPCRCIQMYGKPYIENSASLTYDPGMLTTSSNTTIIPIVCDSISVSKSSSPSNIVKPGENLMYTIIIANNGSGTISNIMFKDTIPSCTTFVTNSVKVNSVPQIGANPSPPTGFNIPGMGPGAVTTVTFDVMPFTCPCTALNSALVSYVTTSSVSNAVNSNIVATSIVCNSNNVILTKGSFPTTIANPGDIIIYTVTIANTGSYTINNVLFTDTIPTCTTFVQGSVIVGGATIPGVTPSPPTGVPIGSISPGVITAITFKVIVNTIPCCEYNNIVNDSTLNYTYTVDPSVPNGQPGSVNSNTIILPLNSNCVSAIKSVNKSNIIHQDTLTYTVIITNKSTTTISNIIFKDTIPDCTTFVTNSVKINSVPQAGVTPSPPAGFNIPGMGPGTVTTVTFDVMSHTCPCTALNSALVSYVNVSGVSSAVNSNIVATSIACNINNVTLTKGSFPTTIVNPGEVIIYTVTIVNAGSTTINNVSFTDTIPTCTTFIPGSVIVGGVTIPNANPSPPSGVTIASISPGRLATITFKVIVNTTPCCEYNTIVNNSTMNYNYTLDPNYPNGKSGSVNSNTVTLQLNKNYIDCVTIIKSVDKDYIIHQDDLNYTIVIKNNYPSSITNINFRDLISPCVSFVPGSLMLNNNYIPGNPSIGITIPNISYQSTSTITFKVTSNTCPCIADNTATITYIAPDNLSYSATSNTVSTTIACNTLPSGIPLTIKKESCSCTPCLGEKIPYTIKVKNISQSDVNNIIVEDIIPLGMYVYSTTSSNGMILESDEKLTWTIPSLKPEQSAVAMVIMIAKDEVCFDNRGYIVNTSKVISYNGITVSGNISDTVISYIDCFGCCCKK